MNKTWNEMTEAEKAEINCQEDAREARKDAMSGWEAEKTAKTPRVVESSTRAVGMKVDQLTPHNAYLDGVVDALQATIPLPRGYMVSWLTRDETENPTVFLVVLDGMFDAIRSTETPASDPKAFVAKVADYFPADRYDLTGTDDERAFGNDLALNR